jgi:hypothetical protein
MDYMDTIKVELIAYVVSNYLCYKDLATWVTGDSKSAARKCVRVQVSSPA